MKEKNQHINQLLNRCKKGDNAAQMQIYTSYYKAMFNTSLRILKDEFEAEDIMQEAFLTAFTKLDTFVGEVTFGAWLKRIVINKSLTQLKKNNKYQDVKMEIVSETETTQEEPINYEGLQTNKVLEQLNSLKDNYRIVLNLNLIEGEDANTTIGFKIKMNIKIKNHNIKSKKEIKTVINFRNCIKNGRQIRYLF